VLPDRRLADAELEAIKLFAAGMLVGFGVLLVAEGLGSV
jgi:hypothetical protein